MIENAGMQVGTPDLDESAHYLIAKAHELKSMAERERPDLLVEVMMSCSLNSLLTFALLQYLLHAIQLPDLSTNDC